MKKNTGITLVALVITIIILLILAGVAISMITGGEGLFAQANEAAGKYNQAAKNEADLINQLLNGNYTFDGNNPVIPEKPKTDGSYDSTVKVNTPDTSKLPTATTKYVTWNEENATYNMGFNGKYSDGTTSTNGFMAIPDRKYYDLYTYGETNNDQNAYNRGKIGDLTRELKPVSGNTWNDDEASFLSSSWPLAFCGGYFGQGPGAGALAFGSYAGYAWVGDGFRPVLVSI